MVQSLDSLYPLDRAFGQFLRAAARLPSFAGGSRQRLHLTRAREARKPSSTASAHRQKCGQEQGFDRESKISDGVAIESIVFSEESSPPHGFGKGAMPDKVSTGRRSGARRAGLARVPRTPKALIPRQRLYASLDSGIRSSLTMVVAPAGTGKTVLLSS